MTVLHMGVQQTVTEIEARFWITQGRIDIKNLLRKCCKCNQYNVNTQTLQICQV